MGHRRQIHEDGSFHTTEEGSEDSGTPSEDIRPRNLEIPWHSDRHYLGPRLPFHFDRMQAIPRHPWGTTPNEYVLPSTDRWLDRKNQPNDRGVPTIIHKLRNRQLGRTHTHGRVCLQQFGYPSHRHVTLLRQLWPTPGLHQSKHYTNE
jgi:hypothetical protein